MEECCIAAEGQNFESKPRKRGTTAGEISENDQKSTHDSSSSWIEDESSEQNTEDERQVLQLIAHIYVRTGSCTFRLKDPALRTTLAHQTVTTKTMRTSLHVQSSRSETQISVL